MIRKPAHRDTETGDTIPTDILIPEDATERRLLAAYIMGEMTGEFSAMPFASGPLEAHPFERYAHPQGWSGHELAVRYDLQEDQQGGAWLNSILASVADGVDDGSTLTLYCEVVEDDRDRDDRPLIVRWRTEARTTTRWAIDRDQSNHAPCGPVIRWMVPTEP